MMWTYNHTNELYHYGVPGMRWGVRKSPEVQAVNKAYKKEIRQIKKERFKKNVGSSIRGYFYSATLGKTAGMVRNVSGRVANNADYKKKKQLIDEKYAPEFKKAAKTASRRLKNEAAIKKRLEAEQKKNETRTVDQLPKKQLSKGTKAAIGIVATVGTATAAAFAVDMIKNPGTWEAIKALTMVAVAPMDKLTG